jgi:transcriptional regulator GlxA family with amidase domain
MLIAIVTFPGFNEIDSFVALNILGRVKASGWRVRISAPTQHVISMNGVVIERNLALEDIGDADAVILGSGTKTRELADDTQLLSAIRLRPERQLVTAQCSGALFLSQLGFLEGMPACTDLVTAPVLQAAGVTVLDQPFYARGNVATAGGCLASQYLAGWIIARLQGIQAARDALHYVATAGEKAEYVSRAMSNITKYLDHDVARTK